MKRRTTLHVLLVCIGLGGLMAYIIACRAAWSPDGSKVLFSYFSPETKEAGVALYDMTTKQVRSVFVIAPVGDAEDALLTAQWERNGKRAIIRWPVTKQSPDHLKLLLLPIGSDKQTRLITLQIEDDGGTLALPAPEVDGNLFIGGKDIVRINLEKTEGERRKLEKGGEILFAGHKDSVYYARERDSVWDIGSLDTETVALTPFFQVQSEAVGELFPFMAFDPKAPRFAMAAEKGEECTLVLCNRTGIQKSVKVLFPAEKYRLGNLQWSVDGTTMYAALARADREKKTITLALGEIALDTGNTRVVPITTVPGDKLDGPWRAFFQVSLSPDGKTIAAAPTFFGDKPADLKERALYLVDMSDPARPITKVPAPAGSAGKGFDKSLKRK